MSQIATHSKQVLLVNFSQTPNSLLIKDSSLLLTNNSVSSLNLKRLVGVLTHPKTRPTTRIIRMQPLIARRLEGNRLRSLRSKKRKTNRDKRCSKKTKSRNRSKRRQWSKESRNSRSKPKQTRRRLRNSKIFSSKRNKWQRELERMDLHQRPLWPIAIRVTSLSRIWLSSQAKLAKLSSQRWNPRNHEETRWYKLSRNCF